MKHDHLGLCLRCLLGKAEGIARKISDVLHLAPLVIMRKDNGVSLYF